MNDLLPEMIQISPRQAQTTYPEKLRHFPLHFSRLVSLFPDPSCLLENKAGGTWQLKQPLVGTGVGNNPFFIYLSERKIMNHFVVKVLINAV
jgi:hypothetical protein